MNTTLIELSETELTAVSGAEGALACAAPGAAGIPAAGAAIAAAAAPTAGVVTGGYVVALGITGIAAFAEGTFFAF
jgi:hypothetical protein